MQTARSWPNIFLRRSRIADDPTSTDRLSPGRKPRLYLHVGTHKTGTTAIQTFATLNRRRLKAQSLIYPRYGLWRFPNRSHVALFHALADKPSRVKKAEISGLVNRWHSQAVADEADVLLSAESIWRHRPCNGKHGGWQSRRRGFFKAINALFADFDVHVIVVLRDQDSFINSYYREHIRNNTARSHLPFARFCAKQKKNVLRYRKNIRLLCKNVGNVEVALYQDLAHDDHLAANFFERLGIDTRRMRPIHRVRPSLSISEAVLKQHLCRDHGMSVKRADRALRDRDLQDAMQSSLGQCRNFWTSELQRETFLQSFVEENARLCQRFFPDRSDLFDFPTSPATCPPEIPTELESAVRAYLGRS